MHSNIRGSIDTFPLAEIPVCFKQKEVRHRTKYYVLGNLRIGSSLRLDWLKREILSMG